MVSRAITHPDIIGERYGKVVYKINKTPTQENESAIFGMYQSQLLLPYCFAVIIVAVYFIGIILGSTKVLNI